MSRAHDFLLYNFAQFKSLWRKPFQEIITFIIKRSKSFHVHLRDKISIIINKTELTNIKHYQKIASRYFFHSNAQKRTYILSKLLQKYYKKRYLLIHNLLNITPEETILDVGCGSDGRSFEIFNHDNFITGIDILTKNEISFPFPNFTYIQCNASDMSIFTDKQFDIAISIGMLEHIGDMECRKKICNEIMRVSKRYAIIVPHKFSFLEPHFKIPLFGMLNGKTQFKMIKKFKLHGLNYDNLTNEEGLSKFKLKYQWLTSKEYKKIFHGSSSKSFFFGPILLCLIIYRK